MLDGDHPESATGAFLRNIRRGLGGISRLENVAQRLRPPLEVAFLRPQAELRSARVFLRNIRRGLGGISRLENVAQRLRPPLEVAFLRPQAELRSARVFKNT